MPTQTLTTQTTASTEVPRAGPPMYTAWQVVDNVGIGAASVLAAIAALVAIVNGVRAFVRDRKRADETSILKIRADLDAVQELCRQFKTKPELAEDNAAIRADLEHEKTARKADAKAAVDKFRDHDAAITSVRESIARQAAMIEAFSASIGRIENAIDRQTERFDTRFDGLQRLVTAKS